MLQLICPQKPKRPWEGKSQYPIAIRTQPERINFNLGNSEQKQETKANSLVYREHCAHLLSSNSQIILYSAPWVPKVLSPETKLALAIYLEIKYTERYNRVVSWRKLVCRAPLTIRTCKLYNNYNSSPPSLQAGSMGRVQTYHSDQKQKQKKKKAHPKLCSKDRLGK